MQITQLMAHAHRSKLVPDRIDSTDLDVAYTMVGASMHVLSYWPVA